jgi:hypothetical protein
MLQRQEDDVFPQVLLFYRQSFCFFLRGKIRSPGDVEERARRLGRDGRGDAEAGKCELSALVVVFLVTLRRALSLSLSLSLSLFREAVSRAVLLGLSRGSLSIFGSLFSLFEKLRRRVKKQLFASANAIFFFFSLSFFIKKLTSKRSFSRKTNRVGARVVRHRRKVGREVRRGHEGCHRASSRSFGLPDGRRRERTVHRKDESVDERVGREVQKIWGLFR